MARRSPLDRLLDFWGSEAPESQQRAILAAMVLVLILTLLLGGCSLWQPVPAPQRCPVPPPNLVEACVAPGYLTLERADLGGMLENHAGWVCGFWACAERQRALAECVTGQPRNPLPVPQGCRPAPAEPTSR